MENSIVNVYGYIRIFKDEGISGAKANEDEMSIERDGLFDMLASLKENKIQYIVVLSTNRLWRSDLVKVLLQRELKKNNVDIKAIDRPNYFTIAGTKHHYGHEYFEPKMEVKLIKEPDNEFDKEAIKVEMDGLGLVGYVANSPYTEIGRAHV